jgi:UDP-N-acetylmuramyl pentapeptide phosphotransferase/UDP-N-acetylglucosamine-1-phosphate transferase
MVLANELEYLFTTCAVVAVLSALVVRVVRKLAMKRELLDLPNERSSHKAPVPRLGGASFIPVVLAAIAVLWTATRLPSMVVLLFFAGALMLYAISLIDDFSPVSARLRLLIQFAAAGSVTVACIRYFPTAAGALPFGLPTAVLYLAVIWIVGLANIYNFMDGIDGIAGLQAVTGGLAWFFIGRSLEAPAVATLGLFAAAGAFGFLTLNWPPAKIFMGDAGSTVLGYIFAVAPILVVVETGRSENLGAVFVAAVLVVWPFLADGVFTILRRLRARENIFQAHRSHLYQRLIIAGRTHLQVTTIYAVLGSCGAGFGWLTATGAARSWALVETFLFVTFSVLWLLVVNAEAKARRSKQII